MSAPKPSEERWDDKPTINDDVPANAREAVDVVRIMNAKRSPWDRLTTYRRGMS